MCSYNRICKYIVGGFLTTSILSCDIHPHECPYQRNKEPDIPEKVYPFMHIAEEAVVMASGSQAFQNSGLGKFMGELNGNTKVYFVKPQNIENIGGKFTLVNGDERININFEVPPSQA